MVAWSSFNNKVNNEANNLGGNAMSFFSIHTSQVSYGENWFVCIYEIFGTNGQQTPRVCLTGDRIHIQMLFHSVSLSVSLALLFRDHTLHHVV